MRFSGTVAAAASLLLAACGGAGDEPTASTEAARDIAAPPASAPQATRPSDGTGWDLQTSGEGTTLALLSAPGEASVRLFCRAGGGRLLVNVPAFRPIGSEERLSFGSGGEAVALVADTRGDARRGGVSAGGAVPRNLAALLGGPLSASYGAQTSGPHPAPPAALAQPFAAACYQRLSVPPPPEAPPAPGNPAGACMMQGSEPLQVAPLRAIGTEPFWAARIEGRCVTYSHPEDLSGTRVWTRYAPAPGGGGTWFGSLGGKPFELRTRAQSGCSDGMSDRLYPIEVELLVGGERRRGCAAPA